jgi:hypothetical protein
MRHGPALPDDHQVSRRFRPKVGWYGTGAQTAANRRVRRMPVGLQVSFRRNNDANAR